jgi:hypothetical protein
MKSFQAFDLYDYLLLLGIVIIAIIIFILLLIKVKRNFMNKKPFSRKNTNINIITGSILIIASIIGYISLEKSHTGFLASFSTIGCQPYVLLSISGLLIGLIIVVLNCYKNRIHSSLK